MYCTISVSSIIMKIQKCSVQLPRDFSFIGAAVIVLSLFTTDCSYHFEFYMCMYVYVRDLTLLFEAHALFMLSSQVCGCD